MSQPTGSILAARFAYFKAGVPYDPVPLPTLTDARYPDDTVLSPLPVLVHSSTGVFTADVFTALESTEVGTYSATAYTTDTSVDNSQYVNWQWPDVGINSVSALTAAVIASIWTYIITAGVTAAEALATLYAKITFVNPPSPVSTALVPVQLIIEPVVPPAYYVINTAYVLVATFRDIAGSLVDPSTVVFASLPPGTTTPVVLSNTHISTGIYQAAWKPGVSGNWRLTVKSTTPDRHSPDIEISVRDSFNP